MKRLMTAATLCSMLLGSSAFGASATDGQPKHLIDAIRNMSQYTSPDSGEILQSPYTDTEVDFFRPEEGYNILGIRYHDVFPPGQSSGDKLYIRIKITNEKIGRQWEVTLGDLFYNNEKSIPVYKVTELAKEEPNTFEVSQAPFYSSGWQYVFPKGRFDTSKIVSPNQLKDAHPDLRYLAINVIKKLKR